MRDPLIACTVALALLLACLLMAALYLGNDPPEAHAQRHNAYWPYSVEVSVRDK